MNLWSKNLFRVDPAVPMKLLQRFLLVPFCYSLNF
uniref:Uncharacterized protein n=1 Tax=Anguilla anguilla TaxID=7936 RepID=A0A0E9XVJ2_ANGAN